MLVLEFDPWTPCVFCFLVFFLKPNVEEHNCNPGSSTAKQEVKAEESAASLGASPPIVGSIVAQTRTTLPQYSGR